jgi:hypothetical protein
MTMIAIIDLKNSFGVTIESHLVDTTSEFDQRRMGAIEAKAEQIGGSTEFAHPPVKPTTH